LDSWKYRWGSCHYDEKDENALIDAVVLGEKQRLLPPADEKREFPKDVLRVIPFDPNHPGSLEELLMSQGVEQEAFTRLLIQKGVFAKEEFLERVRVVDGKRK
jgi:hypothetical protein